MDAEEGLEDNFFNKFKVTGNQEDEFEGEDDPNYGAGPHTRAGEMALPGSWDKPICHECSEPEGDEGGGRYGTDDHEGLFFCGRCWRAWDAEEKEKIMKPTWQQRKTLPSTNEEETETGGNFFDEYLAEAGTDEIEEGWDPNKNSEKQDGTMALPGSWERPICVECGNDEGEEGGGRYGHDQHIDKFYCGRCWMSWDEESKKKMMTGYSPLDRWMDQRGRDPMDPMLNSPPPPPPQFEEEEDYGLPQTSPWQQRKKMRSADEDGEDGNFFDRYEPGEGTDTIEGGWEPGKEDGFREGEMALPGSWERPICAQCGKEEGDAGGGRYGHNEHTDKFFCGRCWKSWDELERKKMMGAYAPANRSMDPGSPMFLGSHMGPPPPQDPGEFVEDYGMEGDEDENEEGEWEQEEDEVWEEDAEEEVLEDDCAVAERREAGEKTQEGATATHAVVADPNGPDDDSSEAEDVD